MGRKEESEKIEERMKTEGEMEMKGKKNERIYSSQSFTRGGKLKCSSVSCLLRHLMTLSQLHSLYHMV
jgi:hypothetical protein